MIHVLKNTPIKAEVLIKILYSSKSENVQALKYTQNSKKQLFEGHFYQLFSCQAN